MILFKNCCRGSRLVVPAVLALLAALLPHPDLTAGQEPKEQKYQRAIKLFDSAQADKEEEACKLFKQIEGEDPNYKDTGRYKETACNDVDRLYKRKDKLFTEGMQLFDGQQYEQAKEKFEQALRIQLKRPPTHRPEIESRLKDIAKKQREQAKLKVKNVQGLKEAAADLVTQAQIAMDNQRYSEASGYLDVAKQYDPTNSDTLDLRKQLAELEEAEPLRKGLVAYYQGNYGDAEESLTDYVDSQGRKRALAYFFRGAVYGSRYFLSGNVDENLKKQAERDFRKVRKETPQFRPSEKFVSPRILELYKDAQAKVQ